MFIDSEIAPWIYLNGALVASAEAKVSPFDRGYHFADGVYEVIRCHRGQPLHLQQHQSRLRHSLEAVYMSGAAADNLPGLIEQLLAANADAGARTDPDALLYVQLSRGLQAPRHHTPAPALQPQVFASLQLGKAACSRLDSGVRLLSLPDNRWQRCDIKSIALLANVMARLEAGQQGYDDALWQRSGVITEATSSSFFCSDGMRVYTPELSNRILPSITRALALEACAQLGVEVIEAPLKLAQAQSMEQMWLASTGAGITPVLQLDQRRLAVADPDSILAQVQRYHLRSCRGDLP